MVSNIQIPCDGGYAKYILFPVRYTGTSVNTVHEEDKLFFYLPGLSLTSHISDTSWDEFDCNYLKDEQKYEYSVEKGIAELLENSSNKWMYITDCMQQVKYASNEFESLLDAVKRYLFKNRLYGISANTIRDIFAIKNNEKVYKMFDEFYLLLINGQTDSDESQQEFYGGTFDRYVICIYAHINDDVLPKDFVAAQKGEEFCEHGDTHNVDIDIVDDGEEWTEEWDYYHDDDDEEEEDDETFDTFVIFQISIDKITSDF